MICCAAAWKVIKTWLSQEAISKIKFATKSDIHTYIDKDQLFEHMGGIVSGDAVYKVPRILLSPWKLILQ